MEIDIPAERYRSIEALIESDRSPVGIDAKKTHVLILHLLLDLDRRIRRLERAGDAG
jgi:hypothetical protein